MKLGETVAARRRIGPLRALDSSGDPVSGGELFDGAGECEISVNDGPFVAVTGTVVSIGDGYFYYQGALLDASVHGFVSLKLSGPCQETTTREEIETQPQGIEAGETDVDLLHVGPIRLVDGDGNAITTLSGVTVEVSLNGAAWDAPLGAVSLIENGYADYLLDSTEVTEIGWVALKFTGTCQEYVFRADVVYPLDVVAPSIVIVSPTPAVNPGDPGGFSDNPGVAMVTPIVVDITDVDAGTAYMAVFVKFVNISNHIEVVYRRGQFVGLYAADSEEDAITDGVRLTIKRTGGWILHNTVISSIEFDVDAVDSNGNLQ